MIKEFQKEYRWLSNFVPVSITLDEITYPSVEHAYMSAKSDDPQWKNLCSSDVQPGYVKRESKKIKLVSNWDEIKVQVMKDCLEQKFSKNPFKKLLVETGNCQIEEGNRWGDTFWGIDLYTNKGQNILGKLIMEIRSTIIP